MYSVLAGCAVFCALGHLAYTSGVPITDIPYGGFSLIFGTWPVVLGTLPGGIHWVRLLFFNLFLLGIDSAFAFVECKSKHQTLLYIQILLLAVSSIEKCGIANQIASHIFSKLLAFVTVLQDTVYFRDTPRRM